MIFESSHTGCRAPIYQLGGKKVGATKNISYVPGVHAMPAQAQVVDFQQNDSLQQKLAMSLLFGAAHFVQVLSARGLKSIFVFLVHFYISRKV